MALVIECSTDSPARTHSKLRETFNKLGGRLSSTGHLFERVGVVRLVVVVAGGAPLPPSRAGAAAGTAEEGEEGLAGAAFDRAFEAALEAGALDVREVPEEELSEAEEELLYADLHQHQAQSHASKAPGNKSAGGSTKASPAADTAAASDPSAGAVVVEVRCDPSDVRAVSEALRAQRGFRVTDAEAKLVPVGAVLHIAPPSLSSSSADGEGGADAEAQREEREAYVRAKEREESFGGWVPEEEVARLDRIVAMLEDLADCTRVWSNLSGWPRR